MRKENKTQLRAKEVFQRLEPVKQKWVKEKEPDVYKEIFGDGTLVNETILGDFIERYSQNESVKQRAIDVFSKLPLHKQAAIKHKSPEIYDALFDEKKSNENLLKQFLEDYEPLNEKVTTIAEFNKLTLQQQLDFKNNFPDDYNRIMSTEPKEN